MVPWGWKLDLWLLDLCILAAVASLAGLASGNVVLIADNATYTIDDIEASFTPELQPTGISGVIYLSEPLDACKRLTTKAAGGSSSFALIVRGGCTFDVKVKNAQDAGFSAAIVYDNVEGGALVSMAGDSTGINIYAVFVSLVSGELLQKYAGHTDVEVWIVQTSDNSTWSVMAISFISLLAMCALLATCFFVRRHRMNDHALLTNAPEFHGMSSQLVRAMPTLTFTRVQDDFGTSEKCTICLDSYAVGDKLRMLPCHHQFHAACVDIWLITRRSFCPVCKRDVRSKPVSLPADETSPLLTSSRPENQATASQPTEMVHQRSTYAMANGPNSSHSQREFSVTISSSKSFADLTAASVTPRTSRLGSMHPVAVDTSSPPRYITGSPYGSPGNSRSSSFREYNRSYSNLRRCGESGPSLADMEEGYSPRPSILQRGSGDNSDRNSSFRLSNLRHCDSSEQDLHISSAPTLPNLP